MFSLFYCFHTRSYAFWFSFSQTIATFLISIVFKGAALIRGEPLIRGRRLFQCGYPKVRHLLESSAYLRPGAYQRKYGIYKQIFLTKNIEHEFELNFFHREKISISGYLQQFTYIHLRERSTFSCPLFKNNRKNLT